MYTMNKQIGIKYKIMFGNQKKIEKWLYNN